MNRDILKFSVSILFFFLSYGSAHSEDSWTLTRCIDHAFQNNPDIQAAEAKINASAYSLDFQRNLFFPRLGLNAATGYLHGEPTTPFAVVRGVTEEGIPRRDASGGYAIAAITLSAPLLREGVLFSKNAPSINKADSQTQLDRNSYEAKKNELAFSIAISFFDMLKNKEDIKTAEELIKSLKLDYDVAISKFKEELISKNELLMAEVKLVSGEKELMVYRNLAQLLMTSLLLKMGLETTRSLAISEEDFVPSPLLPLDKLQDIAISNRSEIKEQEMRISIAKEEQRQIESQRYPDVELVSTYAIGNDYGSRTNSYWTGLVQLNMPLFDFGAITSKIKSQEAKVTEEKKRLISVKNKVAQEVIEAFMNINKARYEIALREKMVEQSMENARLMRARFEQNLVPLSTVLEAEYALHENKKALVQAKYDLKTGYLQLVKATGSRQIILSQ